MAYCRGPYCVLSVKAVERLRAKNYEAFRLEDGVSEWQARGFQVTREVQSRRSGTRGGPSSTGRDSGNAPTRAQADYRKL